MNIKENWLIAWSIARTCRNQVFPRQPVEISKLTSIAIKCFEERENDHYPFNRQLKEHLIEKHLRKKGFKEEWTGWKYTWVKIEESDVPF